MCALFAYSTTTTGHQAHTAASQGLVRRSNSQPIARQPSSAAICNGRWPPAPPKETIRTAANAASATGG